MRSTSRCPLASLRASCSRAGVALQPIPEYAERERLDDVLDDAEAHRASEYGGVLGGGDGDGRRPPTGARRGASAGAAGRDASRDAKHRRPGQRQQLRADRLQAKSQVEALVGVVGHASNPTVAGSIPAGRALTSAHAVIHPLVIMLVVRVVTCATRSTPKPARPHPEVDAGARQRLQPRQAGETSGPRFSQQ